MKPIRLDLNVTKVLAGLVYEKSIPDNGISNEKETRRELFLTISRSHNTAIHVCTS